jgi:predicted MFS family arabinose efflux permease
MRLVKRHDPIRLGAVALLGMTAPMLLLGLELPVPAVMAVLFASSAFGPIINAPLIATIMTRSPEALRAKVMSAVITCALVAGPLGLLVVGPLLSDLGARPVLFLVAIGQLVATLPFVWTAFRGDTLHEAAPAPSS